MSRYSRTPACWDWPPPNDAMLAALAEDSDLLRAWQDGRCAVCGTDREKKLFLDHDHTTGLVRGYLCRSCNSLEGFHLSDPLGIFAKYRKRNPATILAVGDVYGNGSRGHRTMLDGIEQQIKRLITRAHRLAVTGPPDGARLHIEYADGLKAALRIIRDDRLTYAEIEKRAAQRAQLREEDGNP